MRRDMRVGNRDVNYEEWRGHDGKLSWDGFG